MRFFQKEEAENALKVNKKTVNQLTFEIKLATPLKYPRRIQPDSIAIPKRGPFPPLPMSSPLCGAVPKGYSKPSHPHDNEDQLALSVDDSSSELSESDWEDLTCTKPCYSSCSTTKHTNTTTSASSGNTVHWSTLISQGSGDVPWTARLEQMCGEAMTVKLIASDHCIEGCSHWLQVMDSHEVLEVASLVFIVLSLYCTFRCIVCRGYRDVLILISALCPQLVCVLITKVYFAMLMEKKCFVA